jgi:hypothetical protein
VGFSPVAAHCWQFWGLRAPHAEKYPVKEKGSAQMVDLFEGRLPLIVCQFI